MSKSSWLCCSLYGDELGVVLPRFRYWYGTVAFASMRAWCFRVCYPCWTTKPIVLHKLSSGIQLHQERMRANHTENEEDWRWLIWNYGAFEHFRWIITPKALPEEYCWSSNLIALTKRITTHCNIVENWQHLQLPVVFDHCPQSGKSITLLVFSNSSVGANPPLPFFEYSQNAAIK